MPYDAAAIIDDFQDRKCEQHVKKANIKETHTQKKKFTKYFYFTIYKCTSIPQISKS